MLVDRGAINGAEINAFEIDGGPFILDVEATATIITGTNARLAVRKPARGAASLLIASSARIARRLPVGGLADVRLDALAGTATRPALEAAADLAFDGIIHPLNVRTSLAGDAIIAFDEDGALEVDRPFFGAWEPERRLTVPAEKRAMRVPPENRRIVVPADPGILVRQKEKAL